MADTKEICLLMARAWRRTPVLAKMFGLPPAPEVRTHELMPISCRTMDELPPVSGFPIYRDDFGRVWPTPNEKEDELGLIGTRLRPRAVDHDKPCR